jgi:hypothetical protein
MGEFFRVLKLEFLMKSSEKILQLATFSRQKDETHQDALHEAFQA